MLGGDNTPQRNLKQEGGLEIACVGHQTEAFFKGMKH